MANSRDQIRMSDDEVAAFLDGRRTMNVASFNHDATIHLVAMWYGFLADGSFLPAGDLAFHTYGKSQKIVNLRRDPRLTVLVEAGEEYGELKGVELVGRAEVFDDRDRLLEIGRSTGLRYFDVGSDGDLDLIAEGVAAKRVGVRIEVDEVVSWDHTKLP